MNALIVGSGKGSWSMRGVQLGAALGARVTSSPSGADFEWADCVVLVKRAQPEHVAAAKRYGKPIVWDALDFWRQPTQNTMSRQGALALLAQHRDAIQPDLVIGATAVMAQDAGGSYLAHHCWNGLVPAPARERVQVVAYEGNAVYLGRWHGWLDAACLARGWRFVVNPSNLSDADILVGFRDGQWDGWMCREWKSGVKAVNAIAAGRPFIGQDSAARRELIPHGSIVSSRSELDDALDQWSSVEARSAVVEASMVRASQFTVAAVAAQYRALLSAVGARCAA